MYYVSCQAVNAASIKSTSECALVAELVDAADSKSVICTDVGVRVSPRAPNVNYLLSLLLIFLPHFLRALRFQSFSKNDEQK